MGNLEFLSTIGGGGGGVEIINFSFRIFFIVTYAKYLQCIPPRRIGRAPKPQTIKVARVTDRVQINRNAKSNEVLVAEAGTPDE